MHGTNDRGRWGRALVGLLMVLVVAGCGSKKTLSGEAVDLDDEEVQAMAALIEKAADLLVEGKEKRVVRLTKKDLPKAGEATVMAALRKVAGAETWEIERVQRFSESYFRATVKLGDGPVGSVTVNFLKQDDRFVFTGGG